MFRQHSTEFCWRRCRLRGMRCQLRDAGEYQQRPQGARGSDGKVSAFPLSLSSGLPTCKCSARLTYTTMVL